MMVRAIAFTFLLVAAGAAADDVVRQSSPSGGINWSRGVVFATGYGSAKPDLSPAQRQILSRRAATVDAQRNLLEITKGVRITSTVTTDAAMAEHRDIATRVEGLVKGATVTSTHYQNDVATVTMEMPLTGEFMKVMYPAAIADVARAYRHAPGYRLLARGTDAVLGLLVPAVRADDLAIGSEDEANALRKLLRWLRENDGTDVRGRLEDALVSWEASARFSGLLIDASTVADFELATIPRIRDESGTVLYPSEATSYDDIVNKRGVTYDFDLDDALRNQRVATTPLVIRAVGTYESLPSDLVISSADASRIRLSTSTVAAMNKAGVLIVVAI